MIKLRFILNEIKSIPPNRILLKYEKEGYYSFKINDEKFYVSLYERLNWKTAVFPIVSILSQFLDSKHIKYTINKYDLIVDIKYFIFPDSINEIKQIPVQLYYQLEKDIDNLLELADKFINNNDDWEFESKLSDLLNQYNIYGDFEFPNLIEKLSIQQVKELKQQLQALYDDYG